ncbi:MAG: AAA family ATPase [Ornithinibacter sp.]
MTDPSSAEEVRRRFDDHGYLADEGMATAVFLTLRLGLPLLLEGEPGVGKTAAAQVLAKALDAPLVRLQCYEGLTASEALYDWNHQRQLLAIRIAESQHERIGEADLFSEEYLVERPILRCIRHDGPRAPVLLIDEVDRADDEFEALLLEALGEGSVTVPELGTFTAVRPPIVVLTSNRSRDLHDALRRRCLYHWLEYPERDRELAIVRARVPEAGDALSKQVAEFVGRLRSQPFANAFQRAPGIAESVEWAKALVALDTLALDPEIVADTAGILFKQRDDVNALTRDLAAELLKPEAEPA